MKPVTHFLESVNKVSILGSLIPEKKVQDKCLVLDTGGVARAILATEYKAPIKIMVYEKIR